ncbi:MAG: hypothetical protein U0521_03565 [Anaerolineae bacterium]
MPDAILQRGFAAYLLELRLICLHWSYWVLQLLWSAFVVASFTGFAYMTPRSMLLSTLYVSAIPFIGIGCLFLSGVSASRAQRNRIDALEWTFPTGAEIVFARWLALLTVIATLLIAPLGVAATSGSLQEFLAALPTFLLEGLTVLALTSAIVWLLQSLIGIRRWMYPLFGIVWLGNAIVPSSLNAEVFPWALLLSFMTNAWNGYIYSAFWGRLTLGDLPSFTNLCYLGALLLLVGVIGWRVVRGRRYRVSRPALLAAAVGFAIMLTGAVGYSTVVGEANTQRKQIGENAMQNYPDGTVTLPADVPYVPTQYNLALDLSDFSAPTFALRMDVANRGDAPLQDLVFTLNSQLEVVDASVPFERVGDDLRLHLPEALAPGDSLTVDLTYRGALWWYGSSYVQGRPRYALDFIEPDGVNLACPDAWYPIPGHNQVGRTMIFEDRFTPDCILSEPTAFDLRVMGAENSPLRWGSNLPASADDPRAFSGESTWAHLLAAPNLVSEVLADGTITLIAPEPLLAISEAAVERSYAPALADLRRFFPDVTHLTLFVTDAGFGSEFENYATPGANGDLTVVTKPFAVAAIDVNPYNRYEEVGQAMVTSLFGLGHNRYTALTGVVESVGLFTWLDFLTGGDAEQMLYYLENDLPQGSQGTQHHFGLPPSERYAVTRALYDVYVEQGEAAVVDVIRQIRADAAHLVTLTPEDMIAWIKDAAHNAS